MDTPVSTAHQRHSDISGTIRNSPTRSLGGSPRGMIHPPNPFAGVAQASRTPGLAPSLPPPQTQSPGSYNSAPYSHSTSPSTASGGLPEGPAHEQASLMISPTQISSASLSTQKRAYRQRRKDPSCDACRERKVKCDATDTTACSECSSRNHKCQFTKDTNRRMSSIKQVQDLQSQIAELQQQNTHLLTRVGGQDRMEIDPPMTRGLREQRPQFPAVGIRVQMPIMEKFDHVRSNIRTHSAGIFDSPRPYWNGRPTDPSISFHDAPAQTDFAHVSRSYLDTVHATYPVLHWPTFQNEVDQVYLARSFDAMSREWVGVFFAVLACGCLNSTATTPHEQSGGRRFYDVASQAMNLWPQDPNILHVRLLFLLGVYATENNMKSAASMWLACATRTAQILALNRQDMTQPVLEAEMRRRLWWALYVQDRLTSLAANLPLAINEDDCSDILPSPLEDRYIGQNASYHHKPPAGGFLEVIQIARHFSGVRQTLQSNMVARHALQHHEDQFRSIMSELPDAYRSDSDARLEPAALFPIFTLHMARFQLYRRNLSPACPPPDRGAALAQCAAVAHDTVKCIQRALRNFDLDKGWVRYIASHMVCIHLWRCTLILSLRGDFQEALTCIQALAAIGEMRKINTCCGKNLVFFLEQLTERIRRADGDISHPSTDEELLAYASGDLQSTLEHSWVWTGAPERPSSTASHASSYPGSLPHETIQGTLPLRPSSSAADTAREWAGWGAVEYMIKMLVGRHKRVASGQPPPAPTYYPPPHNPMKRVQLTPDAQASPNPPSGSSNTSRISIANII